MPDNGQLQEGSYADDREPVLEIYPHYEEQFSLKNHTIFFEPGDVIPGVA